MRRRLFSVVFALLLLARAAWAQPVGCPSLTYSWTTPYQQGTIQSVSYAIDTLFMQVLFRTQTVEVYSNVPLSVGQASTKTNVSADSWYNTQVKGRYSQAVLAEAPACPLLNEQTSAFILGG